MGLLDTVLGGSQTSTSGNAGLVNMVLGMLGNRQSGGINGLVQAFESQGLGHIISSWIGHGNNLPISPDQVHQVLGQERIQQISQSSGLTVDETKNKLAQVMPELVDKATPQGRIPEGGVPETGFLEKGVELLKGRF